MQWRAGELENSNADLLVLVGGDSNELRVCEGDVGDHSVVASDSDNVDLWLILMQGVKHDL